MRGRPLRNESLNKKKKKKTSKKEKEEVEAVEEEEEPPPVLTAEKARQCSIILAEINRKFMCTTWRVWLDEDLMKYFEGIAYFN